MTHVCIWHSMLENKCREGKKALYGAGMAVFHYKMGSQTSQIYFFISDPSSELQT